MAAAKPRSVVLLSGGMDSSVCATIAARETDAAALHISYGQRTERRELRAFENICLRLGIDQRLAIVNETLGRIGGSALTDETIAIPEAGEEIGRGKIPVTYVPFRNAHFLSAAVSWAEVLGATRIYIGAVEQDSSGYPDCRPEFIAAFQEVANLGTKAGVEGQGMRIQAPLVKLSKAEIVRLGTGLGVDYGLTVSCYTADAQGRACGVCDSCRLRRQGFADAGLKDPTVYR